MTSLLIPNQEGTSDTCTTKDEEAIFEYQDKNGLLTLGWIHVSLIGKGKHWDLIVPIDTSIANMLFKLG